MNLTLSSEQTINFLQLEKNGKAENAGLWIGDILYRINKLPLSGSLDDAVSLVRQSQFELVLEVQRYVISLVLFFIYIYAFCD